MTLSASLAPIDASRPTALLPIKPLHPHRQRQYSNPLLSPAAALFPAAATAAPSPWLLLPLPAATAAPRLFDAAASSLDPTVAAPSLSLLSPPRPLLPPSLPPPLPPSLLPLLPLIHSADAAAPSYLSADDQAASPLDATAPSSHPLLLSPYTDPKLSPGPAMAACIPEPYPNVRLGGSPQMTQAQPRPRPWQLAHRLDPGIPHPSNAYHHLPAPPTTPRTCSIYA